MKILIFIGALGDLNSHDISDCSDCKLAKFSTLPFKNSSTSFVSFDLVHSDEWSLAPIVTKGGLGIMFLLLMIILDIVVFIS